MFDPESNVFFCICGKKIDKEGTCGQLECEESYVEFENEIDKFFTLMGETGIWEGYKLFETMNENEKVGILFELEDELMLLFLQALGQEKVLKLLESGNDALQYRFLELVEPMLDKEIVEEFRDLSNLDKEGIKELLLNIINILLKSVQNVSNGNSG